MESLSIRTPIYPSGRPAPAEPRFGAGFGDLASSLVARIDSNRIVELVSTDIIAMCLPRTYIEWKERGPDLARETAIREVAGLATNVFAAGWFSGWAVKLLGKGVNAYNVHGLPGSAWINAKSMEVFGKLYKNILQQPDIHTPQQARDRWIDTILERLVSSDQSFANEGFNGWHAALEKADPALATAIQSGKTQLERGGLNDDALKRLKEFYRQQPAGSVKAGTRNFNEEARRWLDTKQAYEPAATSRKGWLQKLLHNLGFKRHHGDDLAFRRERLRLSLEHMKGHEPDFLKWIDQTALNGDLSVEVDLDILQKKEPSLISKVKKALGFAVEEKQERVLKGSKCSVLLKEAKYFQEQFIDRATDFDPENLPANWKDLGSQRLFKPSDKKGLLAKLLPQLDEGLLWSARKMKTAFTWVPLVATVAVGASVAFYNNYLTAKKHGGKNFFPGEQSALENKQTLAAAQKTTLPAPPAIYGPPVRRTGNVFSQFQHYRQSGGVAQ